VRLGSSSQVAQSYLGGPQPDPITSPIDRPFRLSTYSAVVLPNRRYRESCPGDADPAHPVPPLIVPPLNIRCHTSPSGLRQFRRPGGSRRRRIHALRQGDGAAEQDFAGMADNLCDGVEQQKAQPLGSGGVKFLG
jgi:hypothetical protein